MQPHPAQDEQLSAYLDGELEEHERRLVEARLESDPAARALLAELRGASAVLRALPRESAPAGIADAVRARMERESLLGDVSARAGAPWLRVHRGLLRFSYAAVVLVTAGVAYLTLFQPAVRSTPAYESAAGRGRTLAPMSPAHGGGEVAERGDAGRGAIEKSGGELSADRAIAAERAKVHGFGSLGYADEVQATAAARAGDEVADALAPATRGERVPVDSAGESYAMKKAPVGAASEPARSAAAPLGLRDDAGAADQGTAGLAGAGTKLSEPGQPLIELNKDEPQRETLLAYSAKLSEAEAANYSVMYISCDGPDSQKQIVDEVSRQTRWLGLTELPFDAAAKREDEVGFAAGVARDDLEFDRAAGGPELAICVSGPDSRLAALANNLVQAPVVMNARVEFAAEGKLAANLAESRQLASEWTRNAVLQEMARRGEDAVRLGADLRPAPATGEPAAAPGAGETASGADDAAPAAAAPPAGDHPRTPNKATAERRGGRAAPADGEDPAIARSPTRGGGPVKAGAEGEGESAEEEKQDETLARRVERPRAAPPASRAGRIQRDADRKAAASQPRDETKPRIVPPTAGGGADFGAERPHAEGPTAPGPLPAVGRPVAASQTTQPTLRHVLLIRIEAEAAPTSGPAP